jgi:hypothetical protein
MLGPPARPGLAQSAADADQGPESAAPIAGDGQSPHDMPGMNMNGGGEAMPPARDGSGTAWLPDETPMYAIHRQSGRWTLMAHGNGFLQYLHESGGRGSGQAGSINWLMGMARRPAGAGHLTIRAMFSLEPWTIRGCGYPDLLASGERCQGQVIHDRQHPHDLVMEIAAEYDRPLAGSVRLQLYGGPVGEPALGPVAFPHRTSAMPNPVAPMTHHWFDATHITYGVVTGALDGRRWKIETSVFNGREPDEARTDFDFGALDSISGRAWLLPTARWALQVSAGRLKEAEADRNGGARRDVNRLTTSATYHHLLAAGTIWASTIGWGRNTEPGLDGTSAWLAETNLTLRDRQAWFGRFELAQKSGSDLAIDIPGPFTIAKLQAGYTRYLGSWNGWTPGVGGSVSAGIVPGSLTPVYGRRLNPGVGAFLTLRPAAAVMERREKGSSRESAAAGPHRADERDYLRGERSPG